MESLRMKRLFVAIPLPNDVANDVETLCSGLLRALWVEPEHFHITLRFLGDMDADEQLLVRDSLSAIVSEPFDVTLRSVGTFPPLGPTTVPSVLWVGMDESVPLRELQSRVEDAVQEAGVPMELRQFHAHVTVARFKSDPGQDISAWMWMRDAYASRTFRVEEFHLIESFLTNDGPIYTHVETFKLGI